MPHALHHFVFAGLAAFAAATQARAAGKLGVTDAWIRAAPPGAAMLAGYATLNNAGDAPLEVLTVQSDAFRMASLHETVDDGGVSRMRELHGLALAPGESVRLKPGGMHLMLMQPRRDVHAGDKVEMTFLLGDGARVDAYFDVVAADAAGD